MCLLAFLFLIGLVISYLIECKFPGEERDE